MTGTISTTLTASYTLSVVPTTVVSTGAVLVDAPNSAAIAGLPGTAWSLLNAGQISNTGSGQSQGVHLQGGGFVSNAASGTISGTYVGVYIYGGGTDSTITNHGLITSPDNVIGINGGIGTVINFGSMVSTGTSGQGVELRRGGSVNNAAGATIAVGATAYVAVGVFAGTGTVTNAGTISSGQQAVHLNAGGFVSNAATGTISSAYGAGVYMNGGASTLVNAGRIVNTGSSGLGVYLKVGGLVSNAAGGTIFSAQGIPLSIAGGTATVVNAGLIQASANASHTAVVLRQGGNVTNQVGGVIKGGPSHGGVYVAGGAGAVTNAGTIAGGGSSSGVHLQAGGSITNASTGTITSGTPNQASIYVNGGAGDVVNAGLINGIVIEDGGSVTNQAGGVIATTGTISGVFITGANGGVVNSGSVGGGNGGVNLSLGGHVSNTATGAITAAQGAGVLISGAIGTVVNAGEISSNGSTAVGVGVNAGGVVINAATGTIVGATGIHFGGGAGTLVDAGTITGSGTAGVAVFFSGGQANELVVDPGAVFNGSVNGGNIIGNSIVSTLELASAASSGTLSGLGSQFFNFGSIELDAGARWFVAGSTSGLAGTISGFAPGDTIEVAGVTATGLNYSGGTLTVMEATGSIELKLPDVTGDFAFNNVAAGTDIITVPCFLHGTRIRTTRGAVPVEALCKGDLLPVAIGGEAQPVVWLGHRHIDCRRHPHPTDVWPVCLSAGAFGPGRPFRDLWLSPDHAVFVNRVLIPIRYLVNGRTIRQEPRDEVTYWHVELAEHDVLYAEGVPAESYLDTGNRSAFANNGPMMDLHPDFSRQIWEAKGCAPLVMSGPGLAAARRRLLARASVLGHATTDDPGFSVRANGRTLRPVIEGPTWRVRLSRSARNVRLVSRVWQPAHLHPHNGDLRMLGVAISRLWLDGCEIGLDSPALSAGWHAPEPEWRWTDGGACIATTGARELAFEMMMTGTYWKNKEHSEVHVA